MIVRFVRAWQYVIRRSIAHWKLLSSVMLGVLLASSIMAGTVIYFDALRELALRKTLEQFTPAEIDIVMQGHRGPVNHNQYELVSQIVNEGIDEWARWFVGEQLRTGKTPTMFLTKYGSEQEAGEDNARSYLAFIENMDEHIVMRGGVPPRPDVIEKGPDFLVVEAMIPIEASEEFNAQIGDRFSAVPPWTDSVSHVTVVISGIFQRSDPEKRYWDIEDAVLQSATGSSFRTMPLFVTEESFLETIGPNFQRMEATYGWLLQVDASRINALNATKALADTERMNATLASTLGAYRQTTILDNALREYDIRLFFSKLPMFVVLVLISIVILYYVMTLSSLVVEDRRNEVALLRSRGASTAQILLVFILEGLTIASISVVIGPLLAAATISILGFTPAFADLSGGTLLTVSLSGAAFLMGGIGGVLSFVALIVPAVQASRITVTQQRQAAARPGDKPVFQRYYLDVLLLVIGILLFRQLTEQGSIVARNLFGEMMVSQILLAVPGVILIAAAMILLRLLPILLNLGSKLASKWLSVGLVLGIWQMARNPTHYARLSLLLILTAGLGIFASSFSATLDRSFEERVLFVTGSDVRVDGTIPVGSQRSRGDSTPVYTSNSELISTIEGMKGVDQASLVRRSSGHDLSAAFATNYEMLAMDGASFSEVAWFRSDFAPSPMDTLLADLDDQEGPEGILIPDSATTLQMRVKPDRRHGSVMLTARVMNGEGRYLTYQVGNLNFSEWRDLEVPLSRPGYRGRSSTQVVKPLTLVAIRIHERRGNRRLQPGSVLIDEVRVIGGAESHQLEGFDNVDQWSLLQTSDNALTDVIRASDIGFDGQTGSALFSWSEGAAISARGIYHGLPTPLPVLASSGYVKRTGHSPGDRFDVSVSGNRVTVELSEKIDYFPTMNTAEKRFLISDLSSLIRHVSLGDLYGEFLPNEMWISTTDPDLDHHELIQSINTGSPFSTNTVQNRAERLAESKVDPLVKAGWRSLLFIAFLAVLVLSILGFVVHAYVSFRNRQVQFALLRTVGLSIRQLIAMVWIEQTLVIVVGLVLGSWMGGRLGATIMPFLGHDDFGGRVMPPFAIQVNWAILGLTYLIMIVVFTLVILGLIWIIQRISLQRVLRLGEVG